MDLKGVLGPVLLDLAGSFNGVVLEIAMWAVKRLEENIAEEWDLDQEKFG